MMRAGTSVGVAVRHADTDEILVDGFEAPAPRGAWARWPLMRGLFAIRTAVTTGQRAMRIGEEMRYSVPADHPDAVDEEPAPNKLLVALAALVGVGVQVAAYRVAPVVIAKEAGLEGAAFIVADAALRLGLLLATLMLLAKVKPFRRILRYHGAEHMVIAAHEAGAPLTARAAAAFSRFHPRCGTSFLVVSALVSIAVYGAVLAVTGVFTYLALIATRIIGGPIVTAISFELQRQASRLADGPWRFLSSPGMAAQRLTTKQPEHYELEVACAALERALAPQPEAVPAVVPAAQAAAAGGASGSPATTSA